MSDVLLKIKEGAKALGKTVVLPEGEDKRVVKAASVAANEKLAKIVLLGNEQQIKAANPDVDLSGVRIVDPVTDANTDKYAQILFDARKGKISKKTGLPEYADVNAAKAYILKDGIFYCRRRSCSSPP